MTITAALNGHTDLYVFLIGNEGQRYGAKPYNPQALGKHGEDFIKCFDNALQYFVIFCTKMYVVVK